MNFILYALLYGFLFIVSLGVIAIISWYLRYAVIVMYCLIPVMGVFSLLWSVFIAIPMAIFFNDTAAGRQIHKISFILNDFYWDVFCFCLAFPFKIFIWASNIAGWIAGVPMS